MLKTSRISGFYKLSREERLNLVKDFASLSDEDISMLSNGIPMEIAERMIENVIGKFELPYGIAVNFLINGKEYMIPMVIEEPSVVAAASNAARFMRDGSGIIAKASQPIMIGEIQVVNQSFEKIQREVMKNKTKILGLANSQDELLVKLGGGAKDLEVRKVTEDMSVIYLKVDVRDAMGANIVNTMCEAVADFIEQITSGEVILRIVSNYAIERLVRAKCEIRKELLGEDVIRRILLAQKLAENDVFRAVTHNKGVMNGIIALAIATGNDTRAIEAAVHSYAARNGCYKPITRWYKTKEGNLAGEIEIPLAVGTVGGATVNPLARLSLKILGVKTSKELSEVMAALGLAQNFAALKALATEGIQRGHMSLHARNIAMMAGAKADEIDIVAKKLVAERNIKVTRAKEILRSLRGEKDEKL